MSARLLLVLAALLAATAARAQEVEATWLEVANVALNLRSGPSTDDAIITRLTAREAVELLERGEAWSHIRRQDGTAGWAHNDYLLPWDERNRPDTWRRVGDRRLFRVYGTGGLRADRYAGLRMVSDHSYIYTVTRNAGDILPGEKALRDYARTFDEQIYHQALELWGVEDPPAIDDDERIVILVAAGFGGRGSAYSWYSTRSDMPNEPGASGTGFIGIGTNLWEERWAEIVLESRNVQDLTREFGLMLHHHQGRGNEADWVTNGIALFTEKYLDRDGTLLAGGMSRMEPGEHNPDINQLNHPTYSSEVVSLYFLTYIYEQLGAETLRSFVNHPQQGLAALDSLLEERGDDRNADDFFADQAVTNYLNEPQLDEGRYGYQLFRRSSLLGQMLRSTSIQELPTVINDHAEPYSTKYYELDNLQEFNPDSGLLLNFRMSDPARQDAWLQLVQVLPDQIDVQRFRGSDLRKGLGIATLAEQPERVFVAVSPFNPGARHRTQSTFYSLDLNLLPLSFDVLALVEADLQVRRAPLLTDNALNLLRRCAIVQVLNQGENWSLIQHESGLVGWSSSDFLSVPTDPDFNISDEPCDTTGLGPGAAGGGGAAGGAG